MTRAHLDELRTFILAARSSSQAGSTVFSSSTKFEPHDRSRQSSIVVAPTQPTIGFVARALRTSPRPANTPSDDCAAASPRSHSRRTRFALAACASLLFAACTAPARAELDRSSNQSAAADAHQPDRSTQPDPSQPDPTQLGSESAPTAPANVAQPSSPVEKPSATRNDAQPAPAWTAFHPLESNAGVYLLHIDPPPSSMPDNEPFQIDVWIAEASKPNEPCRDVTLAIDAGMPEHGHGMNRVPKVTSAAAGHFVVEGLYFHMTGRWELYFDITRGAVTERAQCDVRLAD